MAEVAVHRRGRCIARLPGIHHDHRAPLTGELQGRRQAGGGAADDRDIGVAGDGGKGSVPHGTRVTPMGVGAVGSGLVFGVLLVGGHKSRLIKIAYIA